MNDNRASLAGGMQVLKIVDTYDNPADKIKALIGIHLNFPNPDTRQQAWSALESFSRSPDTLRALIGIYLTDPDANTRQQASNILDELPNSADVVEFFAKTQQSDPDPHVRQFALHMSSKLVTRIVGNNTAPSLPYFQSSTKQAAPVVGQGREYTGSELLNLSPYLVAPRNKAFLSGKTAQAVPPGAWWPGLAAAATLLLVSLVAVGLVIMISPRTASFVDKLFTLGPTCVIVDAVFFVSGIIIILAQPFTKYARARRRYVHLSASGKLLVGHVVGSSYTKSVSSTRQGMVTTYRYRLSYTFDSPKRNTIQASEEITERQWKRSPAQGTPVAILCADDNQYVIL